MKITLLTLSIVAATAQSSIAADPDPGKLPPVADKKGVTYATDIQPIFKASCINCHGEQRQKGGLRLDSLEAALKGGDDGEVITPGKSEQSDLVFAVARLDPKKAMPPMRGPGRGRGGPGGPGGGPGDPGGSGGPDGGAGPGGLGGPDGAGGPPNSPPNSPPPGGPPGGDGAPGNPPAGGPPRQGGRGGPQAKPLTADQVGLIRAWIDQGAK